MIPPVKNPQDYNQALLDMATQSLAELARTAEQKAGKRTPAQESHFLCTWMADSLKDNYGSSPSARSERDGGGASSGSAGSRGRNRT